MSALVDVEPFLARLAARARDEPGAIAFASVEPSRQGLSATAVTLGALSGHAARAARELDTAGVRPGDRVVLSLDDPRRFVPFAIGVLARGCTLVPLPSLGELGGGGARSERVGGVLRDARPRAVVVGDAGGWSSLDASLAIIDAAAADVPGPAHESLAFRAPAPSDAALLQYTSGSTGDPKGVIVTHANVAANCHAAGASAQFTRRDTMLSWLPLHHDMGLVGSLLSCLYWGVPTYLMRPRTFLGRPASWLAAIARFEATLTVAPTFAYALAARRIPDEQLAGLDLSRLRLAFVGAEPIDPDALAVFARRLAPHGFDPRAIYPVYGLAEATLAVSFPAPGSGLHLDVVHRNDVALRGCAEPCEADAPDAMRLVSVGRAVPGLAVRIADPVLGTTCPERTIGEIRVAGGSISPGYFGRAPREGELATGDLGYEAEGSLFVVDRLKDLVIVAGQNHSPADIERALLGTFGLRSGRIIAFSIPGDESEVLVVAAEVEPKARRAVAEIEDEARRAVHSRIGLALQRFIPLAPGALELTTSGKLRRGACRDAFLAGTLALWTEPASRADRTGSGSAGAAAGGAGKVCI
jgi:acyl-CoA synthetase (AMP-forming)/AMP-acid ligase II